MVGKQPYEIHNIGYGNKCQGALLPKKCQFNGYFSLPQAQLSHTGGGDEGFVGKFHQLGIWSYVHTIGIYSRRSIP